MSRNRGQVQYRMFSAKMSLLGHHWIVNTGIYVDIDTPNHVSTILNKISSRINQLNIPWKNLRSIKK